jgi:hypothetical protein
MQLIEDLADKLAKEALDALDETGDEEIVKKVGESLGASSPTLQEIYDTCVRLRTAERRARKILVEMSAKAAEGA